MGRAMAGNGRRIRLFLSTLDTTLGHSSRGLPPRTLMDICNIFKSAAFYRLCGKNQLLALKMVYSTMWSVTSKHPEV